MLPVFAPFSRGLQIGVQEVFQLSLGKGANLGGGHSAVLEQQQGRDATDAELGRSF